MLQSDVQVSEIRFCLTFSDEPKPCYLRYVIHGPTAAKKVRAHPNPDGETTPELLLLLIRAVALDARPLRARDHIGSFQPSVQVDVGASARAEGIVFGIARAPANRAFAREPIVFSRRMRHVLHRFHAPGVQLRYGE